jgi:hypothetical protein
MRRRFWKCWREVSRFAFALLRRVSATLQFISQNAENYDHRQLGVNLLINAVENSSRNRVALSTCNVKITNATPLQFFAESFLGNLNKDDVESKVQAAYEAILLALLLKESSLHDSIVELMQSHDEQNTLEGTVSTLCGVLVGFLKFQEEAALLTVESFRSIKSVLRDLYTLLPKKEE